MLACVLHEDIPFGVIELLSLMDWFYDFKIRINNKGQH